MRRATEQEVAVRRLWHQWTEVVELFARRRGGRRRLRPEAYGRLHAELVAACRARVAAGGARRDLYARLLDLARPWLGLGTFELADREILADLWLRCREAGHQLGGRPWSWRLWRWAARLPAALLLAGLAGGAAWAVTRYGSFAWNFIQDEYRPLLFAARQVGNVTLLAAVALLVVAASAYLVLRIARG